MQKNVIYLVNSTENSSDCIFLRTSHFSIAIYNLFRQVIGYSLISKFLLAVTPLTVHLIVIVCAR